jgi:hypothetical protein
LRDLRGLRDFLRPQWLEHPLVAFAVGVDSRVDLEGERSANLMPQTVLSPEPDG